MKNQILGLFGETIAANYLTKKLNYKIIQRNFRLQHKEIDLIAIHNMQTIFIEVKTRSTNNYGLAEDQLSHQKIAILRRAIASYCLLYNTDPDKTRLDFIAIDLNIHKKMAKIKHFKDIY